jgi:hypothetical protein
MRNVKKSVADPSSALPCSELALQNESVRGSSTLDRKSSMHKILRPCQFHVPRMSSASVRPTLQTRTSTSMSVDPPNPDKECTAALGGSGDRTQVSTQNLLKTGILKPSAGDFREFGGPRDQFRRPETFRIQESPPNTGLSRQIGQCGQMSALPGWGGRIRTSAWGNQNPLPYHLATPQ